MEKQNQSHLRERIMGPPLYMFWEFAGLSNNGLWDRDEEPDDVLSKRRPPLEKEQKCVFHTKRNKNRDFKQELCINELWKEWTF